jgi:arginine repressor
MVKMTSLPLKDVVYDIIKQNESLTDGELSKKLTKEGMLIPEDKFNKLLLDLEILGLVKVSWLTKDTRRIELVVEKEEVDEIESQNKEMMEKDYEASFPGTENNS